MIKKKPIIWHKWDSWFCATGRYELVFGLGDTPSEAYDMWKKGGWSQVDLHLSKRASS